jgi:hypothetical protein
VKIAKNGRPGEMIYLPPHDTGPIIAAMGFKVNI